MSLAAGATRFRLGCLRERVTLHVAGRHNVANAAAAVAVADVLLAAEGRRLDQPAQAAVVRALGAYRGGKRRTEVIGELRGILVMDDYAHHPTELSATLAGLRAFYPERRIVVDFMSHTVSRTLALLADFGTSFAAADEVVLHPVYASAREAPAGDDERIGRALFREVARHHPRVRYCDTLTSAATYLAASLGAGDLLVTMGAGDNWHVGHEVLSRLRRAAGGSVA